MSPELKSGIAFGIVMVVIGVVAIWIVRWQAYFLLRHEGTLWLLLCPWCTLCGRACYSYLAAHSHHNMPLRTRDNPIQEETGANDPVIPATNTTLSLAELAPSEASIAPANAGNRGTAARG